MVMAKKKQLHKPWSPEEEQILRRQYTGTWSSIADLPEKLDRTETSIKGRIATLKLGKKDHRYWTEKDLQFLEDHYGLMPKEKIAKRLKRSPNSLKIIAYRRLNQLNQRSNFYTARAVAEIFGVTCAKIITLWAKKGFIKGTHAPFSQGKYRVWSFQENDILEFCRRYPYFLKEKRMSPGPWRNIVREEYLREPWYTAPQAAKLIGLKTDDAIIRYIHRGWIKAEKRPVNIDGQWIIRKSSIDDFMANDKRKELFSMAMVKSRRKHNYQKGNPVPVFKQWVMKCPSCGRKVRIVSDPNMTSLEVKAAFIKIYINGTCNHKLKCEYPKTCEQAECSHYWISIREVESFKSPGEGKEKL